MGLFWAGARWELSAGPNSQNSLVKGPYLAA
jgi:hypothetical protein